MKDKIQSEIVEDGFYHIEVRPPREFKRFRAKSIGQDCGIERVGGQREGGIWNTVKWLVSKKLARVENDTLVTSDRDAQELFDRLESQPKHIKGDFFEAKERFDEAG